MIIERIKEIKVKKGLKRAEEEAKDWYNTARKNPYDPTVMYVPNKLLQNGKINIFSYKPLLKDKLSYYDKKPVVVSIGTITKGNKKYELGININLIPPPYKWYILETIQKSHKSFFNRMNSERMSDNALKQPTLNYSYDLLKAILTKYNFQFALRTYIPSRKSKLYCISYNNWVDASFLSIENYEGINYAELVKEFRNSR